MNNKNRLSIRVGGTTLLMIFIVLCMTLFASLSLVSAKNEMNLTDKYAYFVKEYYAADSNASKKLQNFQNLLAAAADKKTTQQYDYLKQQCENLGFDYIKKDNDALFLGFNEEINKSQSLRVIIEVNSISRQTYQITQWKKINIDEQIIDESLNVYK